MSPWFPYDVWVAADLFIQAGVPHDAVLARLGLEPAKWDRISACYRLLHQCNLWWLRGTDQPNHWGDSEEVRGDMETNAAFFALIGAPRWQWPADAPSPFSMTAATRHIRQVVHAAPHIGPFTDCGWTARMIGEHHRVIGDLYAHDGRTVYLAGKPLWGRDGLALADIDAPSFEMIGARWMRDARRVYAQAQRATADHFYVVEKADRDSFRQLNERYACDAQALYHVTNKRVRSRSPQALAIVPHAYTPVVTAKAGVMQHSTWMSQVACDAEHVYMAGSVMKLADPAGFHQLADTDFYSDGMRVWYHKVLLPEADVATFTVRNKYSACDRFRPYSGARAESTSEAFDEWTAHFEASPALQGWWWHAEQQRRATPPVVGTLRPLGGAYFSDGQRVLCRLRSWHQLEGFEDVVLDGADPARFEVLAHGFARDDRHVYWMHSDQRHWRCLEGADAVSFQVLSASWSRDRTRAWYDGWKSVKIDGPTFEVLSECYARDALGVLSRGVRKKDIDARSARALGGDYLRAGDVIYWGGKPAKTGKLDLGTARGVGFDLLIDAAGHWLHRNQYRKPLADGRTLRALGLDFFADARQVFYLDFYGLRMVPGADPSSFVPTGPGRGRDAQGSYEVELRGGD